MRGAALALLGIFALAASCSVYGSDDPPDTKPVDDGGTSGSATDGAKTHTDGSTSGGNEGGPIDASDEQPTPVGAPVLVQSQSASSVTGGASLDVVLASEPLKGHTLLVVATGFGSAVNGVSAGSNEQLARLADSNINFDLSLWTGIVGNPNTKITVNYKNSASGPTAIAMEWANLGDFAQSVATNGSINSPTTASILPRGPHSLVLGMAANQTGLSPPQGATLVRNVDGSPSLSAAYVLADQDESTKFTWGGQPGAWDAIIATWAAQP